MSCALFSCENSENAVPGPRTSNGISASTTTAVLVQKDSSGRNFLSTLEEHCLLVRILSELRLIYIATIKMCEVAFLTWSNPRAQIRSCQNESLQLSHGAIV